MVLRTMDFLTVLVINMYQCVGSNEIKHAVDTDFDMNYFIKISM